jgi:hypothetical protein
LRVTAFNQHVLEKRSAFKEFAEANDLPLGSFAHELMDDYVKLLEIIDRHLISDRESSPDSILHIG